MKSRSAAVAGLFYPEDPTELTHSVKQMLAAQPLSQIERIQALVVPHAGYRYSGQIAAAAYKQLTKGQFKRVLLLGPNHRIPLRGIAAPSVDAFQSPVGALPLDTLAIKQATQQASVSYLDKAHQSEHCLEVQLPFVLLTLGQVTLIPLIVGNTPAIQVCELIQSLMTPETLLLISTDLSHFHPLSQANQIDQQTLDQIMALHPTLTGEQACGAFPLNGALMWAKQQGLTATLLAKGNSVDGGGDADSVVGYASIALH
ncbi:AmmeMemoRadiSam system protein B [Moritella sp. Urea-trap-13]|uniref:AmmeMemoRadiSam system protein B n=1 Tax=Moritella sp. Urea-trap-13 TaxID=2058327 RepID=UPI000C347E21|nr:AmmeMemoRadiSam system protein B [Moritella sp. Urea-trap-13]PKH05909.1 AmmeMemoRadiSam system protein B [Moritella sp. Urea-trap-13]